MMRHKGLTASLAALGFFASVGYTALAQQSPPSSPSPQASPTSPVPSPQASPASPVPSPQASPASPQPTQANLNSKDKDFMSKAAQGGLAEVSLSQLALQRSNSNSVKQYAQQMVDEHTRVNQQLTQLAAAKKVTLPKELDAEHKAIQNRLSKLSGQQFDQAYLDAMARDHAVTAALFQSEISGGQDKDVITFASSNLPAIQGHLAMVRNMIRSAQR